MPEPRPSSDLARLTGEEFSRYFEHLAQRVDHFVHAVPAGSLWTKPFPFGNSIGHLVLHLTGNLNHYIGAMIAGSGYVREREKEFTDPAHPSTEEVLEPFHEAVAMVVRHARTRSTTKGSGSASSTTCPSRRGSASSSSALLT